MRTADAFALTYPLEILVVNDGKPDLTPTKLHLAFLGYEPDQAFSAGEVLEMATNKQYDIILLDTRLPDSERIFDLADGAQHKGPIFVGLVTPDVSLLKESSLGSRLDSHMRLPVKRKEFLSQLKACSVLAGRSRVL
jgi:CheY-like chemotaxis protein